MALNVVVPAGSALRHGFCARVWGAWWAPRGAALACPPLCSGSSGGYPFLPLSGHSPLTPLRAAGAWLLSFPRHPLSEFRGRACRQREGQSPPNPKEETRERQAWGEPACWECGVTLVLHRPRRANTCAPTADCCHWMAKNATVL